MDVQIFYKPSTTTLKKNLDILHCNQGLPKITIKLNPLDFTFLLIMYDYIIFYGKLFFAPFNSFNIETMSVLNLKIWFGDLQFFD